MKTFSFLSVLLFSLCTMAQPQNDARRSDRIYLDSQTGHNGRQTWTMKKSGDVNTGGEEISTVGYNADDWMPAIVPGTVLNSLVANNVVPEPYYGMNNEINNGVVPDIAITGRDFYTYWWRTVFNVPEDYKGKRVWMQVDGINYRAEIWVNGRLMASMKGMFKEEYIDITDVAKIGGENALAVKVMPVDVPGTIAYKDWGAANGEYHNGGDGNIGLNTTMLMSVGWDFTFGDGIRDRNTGIWKSISIYATGKAVMRHPFVKTALRHPAYDQATTTVSVEVSNTTMGTLDCRVKGEIKGTGITFEKNVKLFRGETQEVVFTADEYRQLVIDNPRLWWPVNKGRQEMYDLHMETMVDGVVSDESDTRFGIREITSDQNTPDHSRQFYVNGKRIFIRGTNWIPEAMLRSNDERMYAELRYTRQTGINLIRLWGGGIAESDYFYQLCDEMGLLVWTEFWMTGDTKHPNDRATYLANVEATVKRLRNHPALAYYVSSNESTEMQGARETIMRLDGTRGYQMQSECDGIHDGSPYKQVNPMQNYENTASDRGSRIDGFNPEYGAPTIPLAESLREMMDEEDLWPMNKEVWDYHDGGGFHLMTTMYTQLTNMYGPSASIEEFSQKGQCVGAMNMKSIWETWNYNKYDYGDRYASGLLFWYHNCPVWQVCGRFYDYFLEPTASLYYAQNSLQPLHAQFDYLKNTVSVYNEHYKEYKAYSVAADVYDIDSRKVWSKTTKVDIPEDGVVNDVFAIDFPKNISQVHFIHLTLTDDKGNKVSDNFYWRSNDKYEGRKTLTGPATSGFESLAKLKQSKLAVKSKTWTEGGRQYARLTIRNTGRNIAFFTQLQLTCDGRPVRPTFFTDNFFCLLPGERREVVMDTMLPENKALTMRVKAWNTPEVVVDISR